MKIIVFRPLQLLRMRMPEYEMLSVVIGLTLAVFRRFFSSARRPSVNRQRSPWLILLRPALRQNKSILSYAANISSGNTTPANFDFI
jgi:hypothetical protein